MFPSIQAMSDPQYMCKICKYSTSIKHSLKLHYSSKIHCRRERMHRRICEMTKSELESLKSKKGCMICPTIRNKTQSKLKLHNASKNHEFNEKLVTQWIQNREYSLK